MQALAEAVGTFILMFCICAIIAITQLMRGEVGLLEYAVTAALSVVVIVFSIGAISGAHVNPAVTIAFATSGQFPWSKVGTKPFQFSTYREHIYIIGHRTLTRSGLISPPIKKTKKKLGNKNI